MILNEQTYKNSNRPYYIGRIKGYDRNKALHNNYFYLTTDLLYAIFYAGREGTIEEYRLKHGLKNCRTKDSADSGTAKRVPDCFVHYQLLSLCSVQD